MCAGLLSARSHAALGFAGSGSCSQGFCGFCSDVSLDSYGTTASDYGDRCAYGYFVGVRHVANLHPSGSTMLCVGMKTASNGSAGNAGFGVTCAAGQKAITAWGNPTAGYATIINWDHVRHTRFQGTASY